MDPQRIIEVCEANWETHNSDCSGFVKAVSASLGITTFSPADNADVIMDKLRAGNEWAPLGDGSAAKAQADAGLLVVAGLKGAEQVVPDPHGHLVVVVTGPLDGAHRQYPTAYWGRLGSVGEKAQTTNFAWRAGDRESRGLLREVCGLRCFPVPSRRSIGSFTREPPPAHEHPSPAARRGALSLLLDHPRLARPAAHPTY